MLFERCLLGAAALTCNCACSCSYVRVISITSMQSRLNTINVTCSCMLHSPAKCDRSLTRRAEMGCNWAGSMIVQAAARVVGNYNLRDSRDACGSDVIQTCVSVLLPKIMCNRRDQQSGLTPTRTLEQLHIFRNPRIHRRQVCISCHRKRRSQHAASIAARARRFHSSSSSLRDTANGTALSARSLHACCSVTSGGWEQVPVEAA